jgi:hypothetical protein
MRILYSDRRQNAGRLHDNVYKFLFCRLSLVPGTPWSTREQVKQVSRVRVLSQYKWLGESTWTLKFDCSNSDLIFILQLQSEPSRSRLDQTTHIFDSPWRHWYVASGYGMPRKREEMKGRELLEIMRTRDDSDRYLKIFCVLDGVNVRLPSGLLLAIIHGGKPPI